MYAWNDEELAFRDAVRAFVDKEIRPLQDQLEHEGLPPYEISRRFYKAFGLDEAAAEKFEWQVRRDEAAAAGQEFDEPEPEAPIGGGPIANIELAKVGLGIPTAIGISAGMVAGTINTLGTVEQRRRWARDVMTLDKIGAWAITEPDAGSDAFGGMRTSAKPDGDDGWVLNGQKTFISNGPYADTIIVYCKLDDGSEPDRRKQPVLIFVLDSDMEGLTRSQPFKKMGMSSSPTGQLFFDHVKVGVDRLLAGKPGSDGRESARKNFIGERVGIATLALGIIEECQRLSVDYAKQRELWGQPISQFQLIQLKLAEMEIARVNVQNMVFKGLHAQRTGAMDIAEASAIKLYSSRAATEVAMEAVQLFGGNGYMAEYRVEQLARDAKSLMIHAGSNEVQVTHVAKGLLRR